MARRRYANHDEFRGNTRLRPMKAHKYRSFVWQTAGWRSRRRWSCNNSDTGAPGNGEVGSCQWRARATHGDLLWTGTAGNKVGSRDRRRSQMSTIQYTDRVAKDGTQPLYFSLMTCVRRTRGGTGVGRIVVCWEPPVSAGGLVSYKRIDGVIFEGLII